MEGGYLPYFEKPSVNGTVFCFILLFQLLFFLGRNGFWTSRPLTNSAPDKLGP